MTDSTSTNENLYQEDAALGPPGLSMEQQQDIAIAQGQAASQHRRPVNTGQTHSLYVGELDPSVEETALLDVFAGIGPVDTIRVCRDAITNQSLGYAFVTFSNEVDGDQAIQALNYTLIKGKPCRVMWAQKPVHKGRAPGNIFIKNFDPAVTPKSLLDTFSAFGQITECKIVTDERGQSKGYGFIRFDTIEAAERAITNVNGMMLYDRELFVGHYVPRHERMQRFEEAKHRFTNVYVKNLVPDITEEELRELFICFGPILSVMIQRDDQGVSRGFGFVNFERHDDAERAVQQMHDTEYIGKRLFVTRAQKRSERDEELRRQHESFGQSRSRYNQGVNLYIKNLSDDVNDEVLRSSFSKFGTITSVKVMREEMTSHSKGFGFVCFTTPTEAKRAVSEMNGKVVGKKAVYVALAQKKEDRRHQLELNHHRTPYMQLQQPYVPMPYNAYPGHVYYEPAYAQHGFQPTPLPQNMMVSRSGLGRWHPKPAYMTYPDTSMYPSTLSSDATSASSAAIPTTVYPTIMTSPVPEHASTVTVEEPLTMDDLKHHPVEQQKQILGERIYNVVYGKHPNAAGKITGMLLEMGSDDLLYLLGNRELLLEKIQEAMDVLVKHQAAPA
ncbi:polyadenylate binding protein [Hesseltinella vesiculosa]|uniref:Polyadenylate-binding protein n=1 Tax=Hesseltinella vesiculosa TaxID=101127 RepID=A0A1X2G8B9_9FUNG|nr:polyadenylate binding protein [Hesseltinella vesiculosa]